MGRVIFSNRGFWYASIVLLALILVFPFHSFAGKSKSSTSQGQWWNTVPEDENPSGFYDSILYSEIGPILREIEKNSNRVKVDVIGQSAGGRDLFLVESQVYE